MMTEAEKLKSELMRIAASVDNTLESNFEELREGVADLRLLIEALTERVEELEALQ